MATTAQQIGSDSLRHRVQPFPTAYVGANLGHVDLVWTTVCGIELRVGYDGWYRTLGQPAKAVTCPACRACERGQ